MSLWVVINTILAGAFLTSKVLGFCKLKIISSDLFIASASIYFLVLALFY